MLGRRLADSGCPVAEGVARQLGAKTSCRELGVPGSFLLRLEARSSSTVESADRAARQAVDEVLDDVEVTSVDGTHRGRASGATTAPLVGFLVGGAAAALVPGRKRELVPA